MACLPTLSDKDDRLTLIAISALACILQTVLREGLGHGVTAWLSGAHKVTLSTVALSATLGAAINPGRQCRPAEPAQHDAKTEQPRRGAFGPVSRSLAWIAIGGVASLLFVFVLGRGLTLSR
jgi:hypothetical protein